MRTIKYIVSITLVLLFTACEDVIDVKLNDSAPKLVIDASLNWEKGTDGKSQIIKLSLTAPFFDTSIPAATGATVKVSGPNNTVFNFTEEGNTGIYKNEEFIPVLNEDYNLEIIYNSETYIATERMMPVVRIDVVVEK